jgi:hypothetical protein
LKFWLYPVATELKEPRKVPQRAHHKVIIMARLASTDAGQLEFEPYHGILFDDFSGCNVDSMRVWIIPRLPESL